MRRAWLALVAGAMALGLAACTSVAPPGPAALPAALPAAAPALPAPPEPPPPADPSRYACGGERVLHLRQSNDNLTVDGLEPAPQVLLRDAGGIGPEQSVWSNERLRVELGLGEQAQEAAVHVLQPEPLTLHCRRG